VIDVLPETGETVELVAHVAGYGRKLSEDWLYQWVTA
jgi:glucans biosynthesis protein